MKQGGGIRNTAHEGGAGFGVETENFFAGEGFDAGGEFVAIIDEADRPLISVHRQAVEFVLGNGAIVNRCAGLGGA